MLLKLTEKSATKLVALILLVSLVGILVTLTLNPTHVAIESKLRFIPKQGDYNEYVDYFFIDDTAKYQDVFYACGYKTHPFQPFLVKYNETSKSIEWYEIFSGYGNMLNKYMNLIVTDHHGFIYFLTTKVYELANETEAIYPVLLKIDENANIIWEKDIGVDTGITWFYSMKYIGTSILILGKTSADTVILINIDFDGNILWVTTDKLELSVTNGKIIVLGQYIFLFIDGASHDITTNKQLYLIRYFMNGTKIDDIILRERYPLSVDLEDVKYLTQDNSFIVLFSNNAIYKYSTNGKLLVERELTEDENLYYNVMSLDSESIYTLATYKNEIHILRLDYSLNTIVKYLVIPCASNETVIPAKNNALFIENGKMILFASIGKVNAHYWVTLFELKEVLNPYYVATLTGFSIALVISIAILIKRKFSKVS
ncbi:MAG: hypothetical protein ACP6IS_11860 [Candidatus Asgardarchaeia archaeon]